MSDFDIKAMRRYAEDPFKNGEGWYSCCCGEDLHECLAEIERLRARVKELEPDDWMGVVCLSCYATAGTKDDLRHKSYCGLLRKEDER